MRRPYAGVAVLVLVAELAGLRRHRGEVRTMCSRESAHVRELGPCVDAGLGGDGVHEMHVADEAPSQRGCRNVGSRG